MMKLGGPCIGLLIPAIASIFAPDAMAQSSVTIYGILQEAVDINHFAGAGGEPSRNGVFLTNESSFVGMKGVEDLGGGMKASFKLETWTSLASGNSQVPGVFFGTESWVGLGKDDWGTIQLGRQYTPSLWLTYAADPYGRANNGAMYNLTQQIPPRNPVRGFIPTQNSAIQYISPTMLGGLTVRLMYAPGGRSTEPTNLGTMTAASFDYRHGRLFVGGSYETQRLGGSTVQTSLATVSNTTYTLAASYDLDFVKLYGYYLRNQLETQDTLNAWMGGVTVPVGIGVIKSSYEWRVQSQAPASRAAVFAIGYFYPLSKSTVLFASYAHIHNSGNTDFGLWPSETSYNSQGYPEKGMAVTSVELGMRHNF